MYLFQKKIIGLLLTAALETAITAVFTAVFALVMYIFLDDQRFSGILSLAACAAGSYYGSYTGGKFRRRRGLISGILSGAVVWCIFSAVSLGIAGTLSSVKKLLLLTAFSGFGGVCGVNSKRPDSLM